MKWMVLCVVSLSTLCGCGRSGNSDAVAKAVQESADATRKMEQQVEALAAQVEELAKQLEQNAHTVDALAKAIERQQQERRAEAEQDAGHREVERKWGLAHRLWEQGKIAEAAGLMLSLAKEHPDSPLAAEAEERLLRAGLHTGDLDAVSVEQIQQRAAALAEPIRLLRQAYRLQGVGRYPELAKILAKLASEHGQHPQGRRAQEWLHRAGLDHAEVAGLQDEELARRFARSRQAMELMEQVWEYREAGRPVEALFAAIQLLKTAPEHPEARDMRRRCRRLGVDPEACADMTLEQLREASGAKIEKAERADRLLREGEEALETDQIERAATLLKRLATDPAFEATGAANEARTRLRHCGVSLDELPAMAVDALAHRLAEGTAAGRQEEKVERLIRAGKLLEAARALQRLAQEQPETPLGREAAERLEFWGVADALGDDADLEKVRAQIRGRMDAARVFGRAMEDIEAGRTREGLEALQRIAQGAAGPHAEEAEERLRYLNVPAGHISDAVVRAAASRIAARRLLEKAHRLVAGNACVQAVEALRAICKNHPDTPPAERAQDLLMEAGVWDVEITDANREAISRRLREVMREE